jgi:hypothetical protein
VTLSTPTLPPVEHRRAADSFYPTPAVREKFVKRLHAYTAFLTVT